VYAPIAGMMSLLSQHHNAQEMNATVPDLMMQRWSAIQYEGVGELQDRIEL
jgi:hypothetical protein